MHAAIGWLESRSRLPARLSSLVSEAPLKVPFQTTCAAFENCVHKGIWNHVANIDSEKSAIACIGTHLEQAFGQGASLVHRNNSGLAQRLQVLPALQNHPRYSQGEEPFRSQDKKATTSFMPTLERWRCSEGSQCRGSIYNLECQIYFQPIMP